MKIAPIKFKREASARVYTDYMKRVSRMTRPLSKHHQDDIYMEINSHIYEGMMQRKDAVEIDALLDVLDRLGSPEEVLKPLVAEKKMEQATTTYNPVHIIKALILNFSNGFVYVLFSILYLFLSAFLFLIGAKLICPEKVGLFYKDSSHWTLGIIAETGRENYTELLGNWFIPAMILSAVISYFIITFMMKIKRRLNKK